MKNYFYRLATDRAHGPLAQILKFFLWVFSGFYRTGVYAALFLYHRHFLRRYDLHRPVISVGNITLGGVGKTPLVELLAEFYKSKGLKPAILIRGYMDKKHKDPHLSEQVLDEPILLRETLKNVPVMVGRNRISSADRAIKEYNPDIFIMDDGFQHWRVMRDTDIVMIDTTNPFGNGSLIPRGILREPLSSLARAQIFVLTKCDIGQANIKKIYEKLQAINPGSPIVETVHHPVALIDLKTNKEQTSLMALQKKTVGAFCSIGDPESFRHSLLSLGAKVKTIFTFMDHHIYTEKDIKMISEYARSNTISTLVTTQKDAVKLRKYLRLFDDQLNIFSLKVKLKIVKEKDEFFGRIPSLSAR